MQKRHQPIHPLNPDLPAMLVFDSGTELDAHAIDAFRRACPPDKVNLIAVSTVPKDWDGKLTSLNDRRYLNTYNPWFFNSRKVNHLMLLEEEPDGTGKDNFPALDRVADEIKALGVEVKGILPCCQHAWNEVGIARLAEKLGMRYVSPEAAEKCKDKAAFRDVLRELNEALKDIGMEDALIIPEQEICKGHPILRETAILRSVEKLSAKEREAGRDWQLILKPVDGDGSIGVTTLSSKDTPRDIRSKVRKHIAEQGRMTIPSRVSMVQQYIGGQEVGYHGIKKDGMVHADLTLKDMTELPNRKEMSHAVPGSVKSKETENYEAYRELVFPVMEKLYEVLGIEFSNLNADVKVQDGKLCILDAQPRSGFAHPMMLNAAYGCDMEAMRMRLSLDLDDQEETENLMKEMQDWYIEKKSFRKAAIVKTFYENGGKIVGSITDRDLYMVEKFPGIFLANIPDIRNGDELNILETMLSSGGHPVLGASGLTLQHAEDRMTDAMQGLGMRVFLGDISTEAEKRVWEAIKAGYVTPEIVNGRMVSFRLHFYTDKEVEENLDAVKALAGINSNSRTKGDFVTWLRALDKEDKKEIRSQIPREISGTMRSPSSQWKGTGRRPTHTRVVLKEQDKSLPPEEQFATCKTPNNRGFGMWKTRITQNGMETGRNGTER